MRYLTLLFVLSGLLMVSTGCPREGGETDKTAIGHEGGMPDKPVDTPPLPPEETGPAPIVCKYQVDTVLLGANVAALDARYPADDTTKMIDRQWLEEGKTGMLTSVPADGAKSPVEQSTFLDGQLITFMRGVEMDEAAYTKEIASYTAAYGAPTNTIPEWAASSEFCKQMNFAEGDLIVNVYGDEPNRVIYFAIYDKKEGMVMHMMSHLDSFDKFVMQQIPPPPPAEGAMPPAEGTVPPTDGAVPPAGETTPPPATEPPAGGK